MPTCKVCGRPAGFFSDCHPDCAQELVRARAERRRGQEAADWASGARQVIGAIIFIHDSVTASRGHNDEVVPLAAVLWVYHRQVTRWYGIIPFMRTHELVLESRDGRQLSCFGPREEVEQALAEMRKRAPWAVYGYTREARAAMAKGSRVETARAIEARRLRMSAHVNE